MSKSNKQEDWPKTVDEAGDFVISRADKRDLEEFAAEDGKNLVKFHHTLGRWIRNNCGLWAGNKELRDSCLVIDSTVFHPDDASMVIVEAIWKKLQKDG